jgi:hypothetical protein
MDRLPLNKSLLVWEAIGALFIIGFGAVLHFIYAWSGYSDVIALFAPVNESVWEHLKLGFWPLVLFSAIEFPFIRRHVVNFSLAKFIGALVQGLTIVIIFYIYTPIVGHPILPVDIGSFVLGTLICQAVGLFVYFKTKPALPAAVAGGIGLALIALCFMIFTFATPRLDIFRDRHGGNYGPVKTEVPKE